MTYGKLTKAIAAKKLGALEAQEKSMESKEKGYLAALTKGVGGKRKFPGIRKGY